MDVFILYFFIYMSEIILNEQNFTQEVLQSPQPVLVDFFATWCGPCQVQTPIIEELTGEYQNKVKVGMVDVDQNQALADKYQVSSIPTLIIFSKGQEIERLMGLQRKPVIKEILDKLL